MKLSLLELKEGKQYKREYYLGVYELIDNRLIYSKKDIGFTIEVKSIKPTDKLFTEEVL